MSDYAPYEDADDCIAALTKERDELLALVQECSDALGIRDDFVPLGPAIDLAPRIRKALATVADTPK